MQGQMTRPTDPTHIAYAGTKDEMWWNGEEWVKASSPPPNLDQIVQAYNAVRDARTVKRHAWEEADAVLEEDQNKLKAWMLKILNETGAKSIATDHGTAYRVEKVRPSAADWSAFYAWVIEDPERFEALEKRLKATFIRQYMDEHDGRLPPGVNVHREFEVNVRRSKTSKDD